MAAKKTTTIVEEEVSPTEEHDKAVLDALNKDEGALTLEPDKLDEKPTEEVKEEAKVEPPVLDKEAIKEELKAEVTEEVKKEIDALKKEQTPDEKDEYDKYVENYTKEHGEAPQWKQVASFLKDQAKEELKAELNAEVEQETKQEAEAIKVQETQQQELNDSLNKDWDEQLDDLVKAGRIPAIVNAEDNRVQEVKDNSGKVIEQIPLDPGKRARYDLFKAMYIASEERINNGAKPLTNLKEIYYEHYNKDKQPPGANAPVAGVRKSVSQDNGTTFRYSDIHNVPMEDLLRQSQ